MNPHLRGTMKYTSIYIFVISNEQYILCCWDHVAHNVYSVWNICINFKCNWRFYFYFVLYYFTFYCTLYFLCAVFFILFFLKVTILSLVLKDRPNTFYAHLFQFGAVHQLMTFRMVNTQQQDTITMTQSHSPVTQATHVKTVLAQYGVVTSVSGHPSLRSARLEVSILSLSFR